MSPNALQNRDSGSEDDPVDPDYDDPDYRDIESEDDPDDPDYSQPPHDGVLPW